MNRTFVTFLSFNIIFCLYVIKNLIYYMLLITRGEILSDFYNKPANIFKYLRGGTNKRFIFIYYEFL